MSVPGEALEIKGWLGRKTVLSPDAIEIVRNGQSERIARSFIKGYRSYPGRGVRYFTLEFLNEPKPYRFSVGASRVGQVRAALSGLHDLDADDLRAAEDAIRKDDGYGASPDERWQTLQSEKRLALIVNWAGGLIAAWALIFPHPYEVSVIACAAVAPAALALTYWKQARWLLIPRKNDPHPSAAIAIMASAVGLGLRALIDRAVLDWSSLWLFALAGGCVLTAAVLALFNAAQLKHWFAAFVGVAFAYGAAAQADALLDAAPGETFQTQVVSMYISHGRSTTYSVTLAPWGAETRDNQHDVSSDLYAQLAPGGAACVTLHPGALHLRWYMISACGSGYDTLSGGKGK